MPGGEGRATPGERVIAHLSDPHLFAPSALGPGVLLDKRVLGAANALLRRRRLHRREITEAALATLGEIRPDHVVVTGDVSTLGARAELEAFRDLLEGLPLGPEDVTVVPGNHDAYLGSQVRAGHFAEIFGPYQTADAPFDPKTWPRVRLRGELALVACTSARPSAPLLAVGTLGAAQLARLEALLADPALAGRFRLVALHHPPQPGVGHWHNRLTDAEALRAVLGRQGAELVIHGHLHRALRAELPGPARPIPVRGVPSVSCAERRAGREGSFQLYRLRGSALAAEERWSYDPRTGRFRPSPS